MTTIDIATLRSADRLRADQMYSAVALLASIVELVDETAKIPLAVATLKSLVERSDDERMAALLDWWLLARLGERSTGAAYRIEELLADMPVSAMVEMREYSRDAGTPCIPLMRQRLQFDDALQRLERELHHEQGKVGSQGVTWDKIEAIYRPVFDALKRGEPCDSPKTTKDEIRSIMKEHEVRDGSDIWRKILRDWEELDSTCDETCILATSAVLHYNGPVPGRRAVLSISSDQSTVEHLLLGDLFEDGIDTKPLFKQLAGSVRLSNEADLEWFAALTLSCCEKLGTQLPSVSKYHQRIRAAVKELAKLERKNISTEIAQIQLDDGAISAAEQAINEANDELKQGDRRRTLEARLQQVYRDAVLLECEDEFHDEIDLVRADIDDDALDDAFGKIGTIEQDLAARKTTWAQSQGAALVEQMQRFGAPVSETLRDRALSGDLDQHELDDLADRAAQARSALRDQVEKRIEIIEARLDTERQLLEPVTAENVEALLSAARSEIESGELTTADERVRRALTVLDQSVPVAWTADLGEKTLVTHLRKYVTDRLGFDSGDVDRLYVGLKTKRFAILSGVTGSGKSTIARMFAEALGATASNGRFVRIAVRPNWVDESDVIGYLNPVTQRFEPGWLTTLIRECEQTPDVPLFCLLDEMNLAPVEYYLADYLSALEESAAGAEAKISLYPRSAAPHNADQWQHELRFPTNLFLIGTVNVDESTRALSDRVLDRANVFQLSVTVTDRHHHALPADNMEPRWQIRMRDWNMVCVDEPAVDYHDFLVDLGEVLNTRMRLGLGVRAHIEIERFVANSEGVIDPIDALDVALLQRVIPKIRGFRRELTEGLDDLRVLFDERGLTQCLAVIDHWLDDSTSDDDFIDGTHGIVGLVTSRRVDD